MRLRLGNQLFLAISQSGTSADLIEQAAAAYDAGAVTACITNDTGSELARKCEFILPIRRQGPQTGRQRSRGFNRPADLPALCRTRLSRLAQSGARSGGDCEQAPGEG